MRGLLSLAMAAVMALPVTGTAAAPTGAQSNGAAPMATAPDRTGRARPAAATSGDADGVSVVELDLVGVDDAGLGALPDVAPLPEESPGDEAPAAETRPGGASSDEPPPDATSPDGPAAEEGDADAPTPEPPPLARTTTPVDPAETPDVLTPELETAPYSVLGITWDADPATTDVIIRYRVRQGGDWTDWSAVAATDVAPDADSIEGRSTGARSGTDPIVAIDADGLQVWADAGSGTVTGLKAVLIDPGEDDPSVAAAAAAPLADTPAVLSADPGTTAPMVGAAQPSIISRAGWGADESMRPCEPDYSTGFSAAAVHHTASTNSYSPEDVPGLIRGFYAYHTRPEAAGGRGWCDIGYNFLVDKFGRIFEGRAGGMDRSVVGVHTGGFNSRTIGVAAIGDYSTAAPTTALTEGISQVIAWSFTVHRIFAGQTVTLVSGGGASKYPAGTAVTFNTIYGHRDAQLTACPGQPLYDALPAIRARVAQLANATVSWSPYGNWESTQVDGRQVTLKGWLHDPDTTEPIDIVVDVNGSTTTARADGPRPDVQAVVPAAGPRHGFAVTVTTTRNRNVICLRSRNVGTGADVNHGCRVVTTTSSPVPRGRFEDVSTTAGEVAVAGWAFDPDTNDPIDVRIDVGGTTHVVTADLSRPDVAAAFGKGDRHGFRTSVAVPAGTHRVCLYARNVPDTEWHPLECRTVDVVNQLPLGRVDGLTITSQGVTVTGWALDPDTTAPIAIHAYVDGGGRAHTADRSRPDVGRAFGLGDDHGFAFDIPMSPGRHQLCLYAINTPAGYNPAIHCQTVQR